MKPLEIPYNFDKNLIFILYQIDPTGEKYNCIYLPPFKYDYVGAKHNYVHTNNNSINKNFPQTREEYISHIQHINIYFKNKLMLLLQQQNCYMPAHLINWYYNLGFKTFCVGSIKQAIIIRQLYPDVTIIGSITMKVTINDLQKEEYNIFDGFVLFFPYNRNFDLIQKLPSKYKYILLVNCNCDVICQGTHHWFANNTEEQKSFMHCPHCYRPEEWENIILIRPMDLKLFDPYISFYKLQGREYATTDLLRDVYLYTTDWENKFPSNRFNDKTLYQNIQ